MQEYGFGISAGKKLGTAYRIAFIEKFFSHIMQVFKKYL